MSDGSVRTTQFPVKTGLSSTDSVVANYTAANGTSNTVLVSVQNLLANSANVSSIAITQSSPPANSTATGSVGTIVWDSSYVYLCVATNSWKRVALNAY